MSDPHNLVWDHSFYFGRIGIADQNGAPQMAFALLFFRGKNVTPEGLGPLYFSGCRLLEALGSAFMGLEFWHSRFASIRPGWPAAQAVGPAQLSAVAEPELVGAAFLPASLRSAPGSGVTYYLPDVAGTPQIPGRQYL